MQTKGWDAAGEGGKSQAVAAAKYKQPPPTGLLWRQDRLKARLDASQDVADLTKFSLIVLSYL